MSLHVLVGVDAVQAVGHQLARRAVQLGRQLDPGGAGADDRDLQLLRRSGSCCAWARMQALTRRRESARASAVRLELDRVLALTPGVPKSLLWLPTAMTSVS